MQNQSRVAGAAAAAEPARLRPEAGPAVPPRPVPLRGERTILYLTFDGLLQPIAQANAVAYLCRLAAAGRGIHILSLERPVDLADSAAVARMAAELRRHGIEWTYLPYATGSGRAMGSNLLRAFRQARRLVRNGRFQLVHSRSYPPTLVAWWLAHTSGLPYLFDMRGYWVDEKRAMGHWFTRPSLYGAAKRIERRLVRDAAAVITLTHLQARDLHPLRATPDSITVVPTCTDYERWMGARANDSRLVVAYIGSVTNSYCVEESLRLFALLRAERRDAHLLCLTHQEAEMKGCLQRAGIEPADYTVRAAAHEQMPEWLRQVDWGLLLLQPGLAKRGSMPTKLAEFFAAGVRPVQFGCNHEVTDWVARAGSGVVLDDLSEASLRRAAREIAAAPRTPAVLEEARRRTRPYFDIGPGVAGYERLYARLLPAEKCA